ncbi:alpha/beta hydrolase [Cellulomonas sp. NS3]|uniref:alpha/beta hydrolase n=1 Tax=Cellulomonas sp. NS3 TaxID=2973977 RepID=UPI002163ACBB|nr:alpha/beta hydrolase [Cellulomonas sp. NS3]
MADAAPRTDRAPRAPRASLARLDPHLHPLGVALGTAFALLAMTPSLLPRDWLFQGVVSGLSAAAGYGIGVALHWLARRSRHWPSASARVRAAVPGWLPRARWLGLVLVPVALLVMLVVAASWQRELATLMGMDRPTTSGWLRAGPVLVAVAALVVAGARGVRWLARVIGRGLYRRTRLPRRAASVVGALLAGLLVVVLANDVALRWALSVTDSAFSSLNDRDHPDVEQPQAGTRSGSPASLVGWESLGREGRRFVASGPSADELALAGGAPAQQPVRVYVGLETAGTAQERAELALAELDRTGAFERAVLAVVTTTGSGWVNAEAVDGLELLHAGDTAVVATQYSYLPSWLSFLVDRPRVEEEGRVLLDTVSARVEAMPEGSRPRLLVYGESLGSRGSEHAFTTLADIRAHTDGVVWVGPPHSNEVWRSLVERRDPGTPEVAPVYASGLVVRFAADADALAQPPTPWLEPRVVYLQHASDPIVWWSPSLLLRRPDWLEEPRGADVLPSMTWYPVVTFWQVSADMTNSQSVPPGHGHSYGDLVLDAWVAVGAPEGWTDADTERARAVLTAQPG